MIEWQSTGDDPNDLLANVPEGMLRVEKMSKRNFWWCVYFAGTDHHSEDDFGKTLEDAKEKCEKKYLELKNNQ